MYKAKNWNLVKVIDSELVDYGFNKEAVRLTLINENFEKRRFLIFINNSDLINELITITYGYCKSNGVDEKDFIGLEMLVWLEAKNGYLNITNLCLPD
ncbi:Uncharacterised protein [uncultured Clostridium sp.]|uniref:hypothetical protein n=1 Tax=uncultured Clostridium sp. TaxID=59620 RepID=UPI000820B293|nr:hypothetical protein [uncultured Clostridium sp.]SCK02039.1 Uncharacterised protein [uncultured Clostridium sp.]